ncbi:MAG: type IV secretion system protein VirB10 [Acidiphilium sp.]|nr:type IV secretion system protein VirB10 [Acidiphilium sp.]
MEIDDGKRPYGPVSDRSAAIGQDSSPVATAGHRFGVREKLGGFLALGALLIGAVLWTHWSPDRAKLITKTGTVSHGRGIAFHSNVNNSPKTAPATLPPPAQHPSSPFASPFGQHQESPAMRALKAPIFAFSGGGSGSSSPASPPHTSNTGSSESATPSSPHRESALSNDLRASHFNHVDARLIAHPNLTIAAGTIISCTLQTAIDSGLPGFVKCVLPQSVRSMTGTVTLLDRGTQVIGQIQQGLVQGQDRLFILWTRAVTPQNVVVNLGSPAAGPLGRTGVSGAVDNHFFQRFGAAIMLTIIGGSLEAGANAAQSGSGNTYFQSLNTNSNQIANTSLQSTIDIPPTLKKNQGDNVSIFVARDLNFSHVYKLSLVKP